MPCPLLVDDEPVDVRYGELSSHERLLGLPDQGVAPSAATSDPATVTVNAQVDGRSIDLTPDLAGEPGSRPCVANIRR